VLQAAADVVASGINGIYIEHLTDGALEGFNKLKISP
jgi:hypothetical protein